MAKFPRLFEPFTIPPVRLKNRITMAPLFTAYAHQDGSVSELTLDHYRNQAEGGAAMVVVANALVDQSGRLSNYSLRVDDDRFVPGLKQLAKTIKKQGAAAVLQINHGGRFSIGETIYGPSSAIKSDINIEGFYKSALKSQSIPQIWAILVKAIQQRSQRIREMTTADMGRIIGAYEKAAVRAKKAGFDMVEVHGGTGYLPVQFLSARTNRRKDQYGGRLENRMRFPIELTAAVKAAVGPDFPVGYRFLADEWLPGGLSLDESKIFAEKLSDLQIAYLSVTGGTYESFILPEVIEKSDEPGYMVYLAQEVKNVVNIPVITSGRITTATLAEDILQKDKADLIGLARPLFADPQWPHKARTGDEKSIVPCKNCGTCFQLVLTDHPALCSQWERAKLIERKSRTKAIHIQHSNVLVAMDGSEDAVMAAGYVADMLAGHKGVCVTILHIQTDESAKNETEIKEMMDLGVALLVKTGIPKKAVTTRVRKEKSGVARDILAEIKEGGYGTVVLGRRGISRAKQILFGSVSSKVIQNARDCTVWVVD